MRPPFTARNLSLAILTLAILFLVGANIHKWYRNQKDFYAAGSPPKDILKRVEPKKVPYGNIKPPAINSNDVFLVGSATSSYYGVIVFGDYADASSAKTYKDAEMATKAFKGKIRLAWRQLPAKADDGEVSFEAAVLSECSKLLNPQWPAHKALMDASEQRLTNSKIDDIADNLDPSGMLALCQDNKDLRASVRQNVERYRGDGIDIAPFVFVGTQAFPATKANSPELLQAIRQLVKK